MLTLVRRWLAKDMAIDLGTANTIIFVEGQGIVLNEPSVVAIEQDGTQLLVRAVGQEAKNMLGRTPGSITVVRPMRNGVIDDYRVTEQMLNNFIKKVHGAKLFTPGPRVIICVPTSASNVDRRAIRESTLAAGATKVFLLDEPMAAAIGCDLPVQEPIGSMILDIGGGTSEVGIISYGGLVYGKSIAGRRRFVLRMAQVCLPHWRNWMTMRRRRICLAGAVLSCRIFLPPVWRAHATGCTILCAAAAADSPNAEWRKRQGRFSMPPRKLHPHHPPGANRLWR